MRKIVLTMAMFFLFLQLPAGAAAVSAGANTPQAGRISELVSGNTRFALDMYKKLSVAERDKNMFLSPYSISTALGMTYAGARGNTERQMAEVLHFSLPGNDLHRAFAGLAESMHGQGGRGYLLSTANALWGQRGYHFKDDFQALVREFYQGGFNTVDFAGDPEGSRRKINQWVEEKTADKIKNLLQKDDITSQTRLVLTNAVYFKGDWADKFKKENTRPASFYTRPGEKTDVAMMSRKGRFGYAATDEVQVLELPYAGGELSMIVLLPAGNINEFGAKLTPEKLNCWLAGLENREVAVFLPKFKFTARYQLGATLADMGMTDAFSLRADFSGMTGDRELRISKVVHQAFIDVNEDGSEAAAATAVIVIPRGVLAVTPEFRADRPFVFLIRQKSTGAILFIGRVVNPALQ